MDQLPRLKARITSLSELRNLFAALRALAASHIRDANAAVAGIRQYTEIIEDAISEAASFATASDRDDENNKRSDSLLIVVCSEHSFVGSFNEQLLDRATAELRPGQQLGIIGARGALLAAERGLVTAWDYAMATHTDNVLTITRPIVERMENIAEAAIVYAQYRPGGGFEVRCEQLLPLAPALLSEREPRNPPLHHLPSRMLLRRLAGEYLFAEITRAVTESLASENAARLRVMESADHNIGDKLQDLTLKEQAVRQESITSELLDVVTGAEAILGKAL